MRHVLHVRPAASRARQDYVVIQRAATRSEKAVTLRIFKTDCVGEPRNIKKDMHRQTCRAVPRGAAGVVAPSNNTYTKREYDASGPISSDDNYYCTDEFSSAAEGSQQGRSEELQDDSQVGGHLRVMLPR